MTTPDGNQAKKENENNINKDIYTITFISNGANGLSQEKRKLKYGQIYGELPRVTNSNSNLIFLGWFTDPKGGKRVTSKSTMEAKDINLFAQYAPKETKFYYVGDSQIYQTPNANATYLIECWGARGGYKEIKDNQIISDEKREKNFCFGAYTKGEISFSEPTDLFIFVGEAGTQRNVGTFNGGGRGGSGGGNYSTWTEGTTKLPYIGNSGGGATDIRLKNGEWNDFESLKTRIMVAGGGGGIASYLDGDTNCCAGGLIGYSGTYYAGHGHDIIREGLGGSQILGGLGGKGSKEDWYGFSNNGSFGIGGDGSFEKASTQTGSGGGGGGYYGGGSGSQTKNGGWGHGGGGGSSFISGHEGCIAINPNFSEKNNIVITGSSILAYNKKNYIFKNTDMIDGKGCQWTNAKGPLKKMPNPEGGFFEKGNIGNGFAKITIIEVNINE